MTDKREFKGHTPGSWEVEQISRKNAHIYAANRSGSVAIVYATDSVDHATMESNAYLIAASPDLLAACLEAAAIFSVMNDGNQLPSFAKESWNTVATAITKAKGFTVMIQNTPYEFTVDGYIIDCNSDRVGEVYPKYLDHQNMHIARLFAAAPDLLAALEALLAEINPPEPGSIGEIRVFMVLDFVRAAIAKANGNTAIP